MTGSEGPDGSDGQDGAPTHLSTGKFRRKPAGRYHHGDLRQALLATAGRVVERDGVAALSLRAIARELGVTHMAVYHHFRDRRALLAALAVLGYDGLREAMAAAAADAGSAPRALRAVGRAYVVFAVSHPGEFRVMFSSELAELRHEPPLRDAVAASYRVFADAIAALVPDAAAAARRATAAWALVHGLSVLLLDRQIEGYAPTPEQAERLALTVLPELGLATPPPAHG